MTRENGAGGPNNLFDGPLSAAFYDLFAAAMGSGPSSGNVQFLFRLRQIVPRSGIRAWSWNRTCRPATYAKRLRGSCPRSITCVRACVQTGNARDWANESFQIASREIYRQLSGPGDTDAPIILPAGYAAAESAAVRESLKVRRALGLGFEYSVAVTLYALRRALRRLIPCRNPTCRPYWQQKIDPQQRRNATTHADGQPLPRHASRIVRSF